MTSRDEQYRRNAQRLRAQVVEMGAEIIAKRGDIDRYLLSDEEKAEARAKASSFFANEFRRLQAKLRLAYADPQDVLHEPSGQPGDSQMDG